jgi:hypothetical protein
VAERLGWKQTANGFWTDAEDKLLDDPAYMPEWATDIGAAWGLVEKMNVAFTSRRGDDCFCEIRRNGKAANGGAVAKTAPRAICIAFLMATEAGK